MGNQIHAGCMKLGQYSRFWGLFGKGWGTYVFNRSTGEGIIVELESPEQFIELRGMASNIPGPHQLLREGIKDYSVQSQLAESCKAGEYVELLVYGWDQFLEEFGNDGKD